MRGQKLPNYYQIIGVRRDASTEKIRSTYRQKVRRYHPDVRGNMGEIEQAMADELIRLLNDAHDTLTDPVIRSRYDSDLTKQLQEAENKTARTSSVTRSSQQPTVNRSANTQAMRKSNKQLTVEEYIVRNFMFLCLVMVMMPAIVLMAGVGILPTLCSEALARSIILRGGVVSMVVAGVLIALAIRYRYVPTRFTIK